MYVVPHRLYLCEVPPRYWDPDNVSQLCGWKCKVSSSTANVPARLCVSAGLSVPLEAKVGFTARPAGAGENCPAAISVKSPVSVDFPIAIVLGGMAVANGDV